jgi:hypothetical protein
MADSKTEAPFVFEGTVKSLTASNVSTVPADNQTAVVGVDHVRQAPRALAGLAGKEITVRMAPGEALKAGEKAVFFADGLVFGENLAVQSRGHNALAAAEKPAAVMAAAPVVQGLRRRIDQAQSVVSGRVIEVRAPKIKPAPARLAAAAAPAMPADRISEHEPFWQEAVIEVSEVHKGPRQKRVVVRFPSSTDVQWRKAPKFKKGQAGVWLLHADSPAAAAAVPGRARGLAAPSSGVTYTALDPNDFHPPSVAPVVKAMLPGPAAPVPRKKTPARKPAAKKAIAKKASGKTTTKKRRS